MNEGTSYIPVNLLKNAGNSRGKVKPQDTESTRLQELSQMNSTYFGAIHYDIHLDMKLDYTISRIFQEMSLSELETLHQLCELERTQFLQSLALAVLKIPYAGFLLSGNISNFFDYEGNILWFNTCTKKVSPLYVFEDKRCYKRIPIFYNNKVPFVDTLSRRTYFWDTAVPCGSKKQPQRQTIKPRRRKILPTYTIPNINATIEKVLDAQIKEYNTKLSANPNTYDESNNNTNTLPTSPHSPNLHHNHPLSLVSRNLRNLAITNPPNLRPSHIQSPIQHIVTQHPQNDDTYKQLIEQPHTTTFQSQNSHFFSPR